MIRYIIKRLLSTIPVILGVLTILFFLYTALPGDFVNANLFSIPNKDKPKVRAELHLDQPKIVQFNYWLKGFIKGDMGNSFITHQSVADTVNYALKKTMILAVISIVLGILIAVPAGTIAALKNNGTSDRIITLFSIMGVSIPPFILALILKVLLTFNLTVFNLYAKIQNPIFSFDQYSRFVTNKFLPVFIMTLYNAATFTKYIKTSVLEVINEEYINTARSKGIKEKKVVYKHALKNAMIPVINIIGANLPTFFSSSFVVEAVLGWNGIGSVYLMAIGYRDYPLLMGINFAMVIVALLGNITADISSAIVDPRIRIN